MGAFLTESSLLLCPHFGRVKTTAPAVRAQAVQGTLLHAADATLVEGCVLQTSNGPHPCVTVVWSEPTTRCVVGGQPVLTESSTGRCFAADGTPQGTVIVSSQQKARGQ
ncbi:hypothetical protein [Polyangium fumosum]|uniref:Uncharacterized protein n=1 Tax=Polyangium fumosum TaxID=889272 RepID=A0A4U1INX5_9BACT|nr:hypothetical protein [Polyangium fumosum]TKC95820.1 hypothetical protein E8A74_46430 [Polyangium fumosum]